MRATTKDLLGPGDLFANLPGILGFYPEDSLVLLSLHLNSALDPGDPVNPVGAIQPTARRIPPTYRNFAHPAGLEGRQSLTLGPAVRFDLTDYGHTTEILAQLHCLGASNVWGFVVSEQLDEPIRAYLRRARYEQSQPALEIDALWHVGQVVSGEEYRLVFDRRQAGTRPVLKGWESGVVSEVITAASMSSLITAGELPELHRGDTLSYFAADKTHFSYAQRRLMVSDANHASGALVRDLRGRRSTMKQALRSACAALEAVAKGAKGEDASTFQHDEAQLISIASCLAHSLLRDGFCLAVLDTPHAAERALLAVIRCFSGTIRANALCLYALATTATKRHHRAAAAIRTAVDENSTHRLTELMDTAIRSGSVHLMIDAARSGGDEVHSLYA